MAFTKDEFIAFSRPILQKAAEDEDFRCKCLDEPHAALEEMEGVEVPEGMKLTFVDQMYDEELPDANEVVVELTEENYCKFKQLEKGVCKIYTFEVNEAPGDYDLTDCAEVQD
jgi:hypothetical protein